MLYSDEAWTGLEYQVASHLIAVGELEKGLEIVRAVRRRYDGRIRNPFCEVEAGYWYARAMSSYALLQALSGARFDAVDKILHLRPRLKGDFRCLLSTATGYGTVGVSNGSPFLEIVSGTIPCTKIEYYPALRGDSPRDRAVRNSNAPDVSPSSPPIRETGPRDQTT
jgi:familyl 116 glycosyl hydrolase-like protein